MENLSFYLKVIGRCGYNANTMHLRFGYLLYIFKVIPSCLASKTHYNLLKMYIRVLIVHQRFKHKPSLHKCRQYY